MTHDTVAFALKRGCDLIAPSDAESLLAQVLQVNRAYLFAYPEKILSALETKTFDEKIKKCAAGEPVAYLTGRREFWSQTLKVTPDTLIPRPETECLVETLLTCLTKPNARVADCGTGSGAIAIALALEKPHWEIHATDLCQKALNVAFENVKTLGISTVSFHQGDWCLALPNKLFDAIVSNPPYLAADDPHLLSLQFEPTKALVAGPGGLEAIAQMIRQAEGYLAPGGWLLLEHGYQQGESVRSLLARAHYAEITTFKDLSGHERVTQGRRPIN